MQAADLACSAEDRDSESAGSLGRNSMTQEELDALEEELQVRREPLSLCVATKRQTMYWLVSGRTGFLAPWL